jgi:murein DD-endopeptidase MepM/ murein hydrolase activator NlpD
MYCHLDEPGVMAGTVVKAGETVGLLGSSGNSSGPHLHLEVRLQNQDGTYREDTPMGKGRCDPETWCILHGLKL